MPYGKTDNVNNNVVNYIGRDFNDLKSSLINYSKAYFPNTYKDFNETSPGMMLIELSAYVGDVLNFYIDNQYKEMMLPLAEERRNLLNIAKSHGYKVNPISPAYADLTITTLIGANTVTGNPDYSDSRCVVIDKGMQVTSILNTSTVFETLDVVDFQTSSSSDPLPEIFSINSDTGAPERYKLTRTVKSISGETKTKTYDISEPKKFFKLVLPESNVIEIIKITDSNGNRWYEVESLAQDKVPYERHYTSDQNRNTSYMDSGGNVIKTPVPYSLEYIKTTKRFVTEIDTNNKMNIIFGNGLLKNGTSFNSTFLAVEQVGINLPGGEENLEDSIDPLLGDAYGTLGEAPSFTTLTVQYRVGGGIDANIAAASLSSVTSLSLLGGSSTADITCINKQPAAGGSAGETIEEIRHRAMAHISSQNRAVTKEDYEARTLNMSAKFGNVAKVYCGRSGAIRTAQREKMANLVDRLKSVIDNNYDLFDPVNTADEQQTILDDIKNKLDADQSGGLNKEDFTILYETLELTYQNVTQDDRLYTVDLYLLSYNNNKQLIKTPNIIKQNLKQYLNQYRLLTDQVSFYDGHVINFGVIFDVVGKSYENKDEVKLQCIQAIKDYFTSDKMQFKQIIYTTDLENLLMDVEGTRAVNYVTLTQDFDYNAMGTSATDVPVFSPSLYTTYINSDGSTSQSTNNPGYGYYYDFGQFYGTNAIAGRGVVLPSYEPSVFELKHPNRNIKGIVR